MRAASADDTSSDAADITVLALDHPGAQDPEYRRRRDAIAVLARRALAAGGEPPALEYLPEEHATWTQVLERLEQPHQEHASRRYLECRSRLGIETERIPALTTLSEQLARHQGFRLMAIPGLIPTRPFLASLAQRRMPCTQYIRHASRPDYTPEPDVVHEVVGHVPLFADPEFAALSEHLGRAAAVASDGQVALLDRLYWFTLEFGLVEERGELKAYGAGLLSSFGELPHAFTAEVEKRPFVAEEAVTQPYDHTQMQPTLFVASSFVALQRELERFLAGPMYRSA
jgi:monomeric phenylalanine-4-hydroxylase